MSGSEIIIISAKNNFNKPKEAKFFLSKMKNHIIDEMYRDYPDDEHREWWLDFGEKVLDYKESRKTLLQSCPRLQNLTGSKNINKVKIKELIDLRWELLINENCITEIIPSDSNFIFIFCQNSAGSWESIWTLTKGKTNIKDLHEFTVFSEYFNLPS